MASLLRQIVAGPRAKHAETGLDLCYVTSNIIATSGPSQTYPQRAYRNPLDRLVAFLDSRHGDGWAIWEFRAEGTGYPDEAVYNRIRHYPWPDHHPPPFALVPMIMASMRNWLREGGGEAAGRDMESHEGREGKSDKVIVVHCKAGKGRSGSMACSFLVSECGWSVEDALARFTERRMRPGFGKGVSIPSQLRWIGYVDRWTKGGKKYVDREVEVVEIHVWGLRNGVKVGVEGFVDEGKKIKVFHTFTREERIVVEGDAPGGGGVVDLVTDMYSPREDEPADGEGILGGETEGKTPQRSKSKTLRHSRTSKLMDRLSGSGSKVQSQTDLPATGSSSPTLADSSEPGGQAVIFKPAKPILIPNSDINISVERRNRPPASMGMMTMVTAVAHVWFNTYFEGNGPEQDGEADESGVFEIDWEKMDGIKGSSRKGTRAFDKIAVVWRAAKAEGEVEGEKEAGIELPYLGPGIVIDEPGVDSPVPQMRPADWKGENEGDPDAGKGLGLRAEDPDSAAVSKASSVKSADSGGGGGVKDADDDGDSLKGVKTSGPEGEEELDVGGTSDATKEGGTIGRKEKADVVAQKGFVVE
ncbi:phosphatases II [Coniochaeta ligniaria NRRL 30616]|uniref:phosphatidylinositol-3,4,5-trisphosphate 3-phosphatase n=1 Tax=Coniochaeta ligniaria NRRL 30616 TaxID=1408157 RepID=A0A1J7IN23_9PEZI|nr:phosphatases II [Coniochaeta ligniaria NRRL 30616]